MALGLKAIIAFFQGFNNSERRKLRALLGFYPQNIGLYHQAFRHNSVAKTIHENTGARNSNERLEYLGDAVLSVVIAEFAFKKFPYRDEGFLTQMRSKMVSREMLGQVGRKIGLEQFVKLDTRNISGGSNGFQTALGNALEALVGAVYMDQGFKMAQLFVIDRLVRFHMDVDHLEATDTNYKSRLIEWAQRSARLVTFGEPENVQNGRFRLLRVKVFLDGEEYGEGLDHVKKKAEQIASEKACQKLGI